MVQDKGINLRESATLKPVPILTGQEAYFALLAQDMCNIASYYGKSLTDVHKIFYEVSCNREKLIQVLKDMQKNKKSEVKQWQTLEDLALRHTEDTPSFQVVLQEKGREEVNIRKAFLELN